MDNGNNTNGIVPNISIVCTYDAVNDIRKL